jgi:hypothetical protein
VAESEYCLQSDILIIPKHNGLQTELSAIKTKAMGFQGK